MIKTDSKIDFVLGKLERVKQAGPGKWTALCPAHEDKNPSLGIAEGKDGRVLLRCFAGCSFEDICAGAEIDTKDCSPDREPQKTIAATYDYQDETGNLLFQKVRYAPKNFVIRVPDGRGGYTYSLNGARRVLYNLPAMIQADTVFIAEGEKDCDTLRQKGYTAVCNFDGAAAKGTPKWRPEYNPFFQGKTVYILFDDDPPGKRHAANIYEQIKDLAKTCRIVPLPGAKDVSDWFAAGHTKEEFDALCQAAQPGPFNLDEPQGKQNDRFY